VEIECKDKPEGVHCRVKVTGEFGPTVHDIVFTSKQFFLMAASDFGRESLSPDANVYKIGTNDPNLLGEALWEPSQQNLLVRIGDGPLRPYNGASFRECVLKAFKDGLFS